MPPVCAIDPAWLTELELRIAQGRVASPCEGVSILGYGEISAVLSSQERPQVVLKRMAGFRSEQEATSYAQEVRKYIAFLTERNVHVLETEVFPIQTNGRIVVYLVQPRLEKESIGNHLLLHANDDVWAKFLSQVLSGVVAALSSNTPELSLGLDAQISNWAWVQGQNSNPEARATYLDVGTPLFREHGRLAIAPALSLRSLPRPFAFLLRHTLFEKVVGRYFLPREAAKDIAGNFIKEGRPERIAAFLKQAAPFLSEHAKNTAPLTETEIHSYYREDKMIWRLFQGLRRFDRFVTAQVLRNPYDFILP
jgi:hypothetical protein